MIFVILPFFALILKLMYLRKNKYFYTDHVIFTIHFYIFLFLTLLVVLAFNKMAQIWNISYLQYVSILFDLYIFFYFYKALRKFYNQGRAKTLLKYFLILTSSFILSVMIFIIFVFLSIFEI